MKAKVELTKKEVYEAIAGYIYSKTRISVGVDDIKIEVKSEQNYKSEWEQAAIRCSFSFESVVTDSDH